jgi:PAS domain S-box-containing protein
MEESVEELYEQAPCGYFSCLPDGTFVKLNATLLGWLGYERAELLYQRRFQDLLTIGGRLFYDTHFGPLLQLQGAVSEISFRLRRKDGRALPVLINAVQVPGPEGQPLLSRVTVFNATDRDKYEQELLQAKRRAEEESQLKARFASVVSHEVRTPLHAIHNMVDLLLEEPDETKRLALKRMLRASADDLLALVNQVLDYGKLETSPAALNEAPVDLRHLLRRVLEPLALRANEKGLALHAEVDATVPARVMADAVKLTQVLTNLANNAIKFTEHGSVTVRLHPVERTEQTVSLLISVRDTGIGIQAEQLARIFEEYQQGDAASSLQYGGTGLGLAISQQIAQLHGSRIQVRSTPGGGAEFYFLITLPVVAAAPAASGSASAAPELQPLPSTRVLIADDNQYSVFVLTQYLKRWQVAFDVVADGEAALRQVQATPYDLVLLDWQMPVVNGAEVLRRLRELGPELGALPVVVQSALEPAELRQLMVRTGFTDFLAKPFRPEQLHAVLARYAAGQAAPRPVTAAGEAAAPAFRLDTLHELTKGDSAALATAVSLILGNLTEFWTYCATLPSTDGGASGARDFAERAHKLKPTLGHLHARPLQTRVAHVIALFESGADAPVMEVALQALREQLQRLIQELQELQIRGPVVGG